MKTLFVEVVDDKCADGEAHMHQFPPEASMSAIVEAIETIYPTVTSLYMYVGDTEESEE